MLFFNYLFQLFYIFYFGFVLFLFIYNFFNNTNIYFFLYFGYLFVFILHIYKFIYYIFLNHILYTHKWFGLFSFFFISFIFLYKKNIFSFFRKINLVSFSFLNIIDNILFGLVKKRYRQTRFFYCSSLFVTTYTPCSTKWTDLYCLWSHSARSHTDHWDFSIEFRMYVL